jgi:hypothetical protein
MADSVEQVVYEYLTADSSFMGNFTGVYWVEAETETTPYITFWLVTDAGTSTRLGKVYQGEARIQFDLWDENKIRGARLRTELLEKVERMSEERGGYHVMVTGTTSQTIPRESHASPHHFVVDGVIKWEKI